MIMVAASDTCKATSAFAVAFSRALMAKLLMILEFLARK
jgi:hypothetical protein